MREPKEFSINEKVNKLIGTQFEEFRLIDTSGKNVTINYKNFDYTIVDFWFSECPPCLKEMKQFSELLRKAKSNIQIVSISINNYQLWKGLFSTNHTAYSFLSEANTNWRHYTLRSDEDPNLKNDIPGDNYNVIQSRYNTHDYPLYLVLNEEGKIITTPRSAVEYLEFLSN